MIAMFCGVLNCPIASIVLSIELFGSKGFILFAIAAGVSYMLSGYYGLYSSQKIMYSKLKAGYKVRQLKFHTALLFAWGSISIRHRKLQSSTVSNFMIYKKIIFSKIIINERNKQMILGYSIYELLWLFFIYAFFGWCIEVVFCGLNEGHFINRGFLNGPVCPIYGVGGVIVVLCLTPIKDNIFLLFVGSALLTSILELITGFALDKIFHARWWDYTDMPFNIGGYICLKFSIYWGFVCIALMKGIHPVILGFVRFIPHMLGLVAVVFFAAVFVADVIITVITINNLTKRVKLMNDIAKKIHNVSDEVGEHIYYGANDIMKKGIEIYNSENVQEIRENLDDMKEKYEHKKEEIKSKHKDDLDELKAKYDNLVKETHIFQKRIIKAFPNLTSRRYEEQLAKLKEKTWKFKKKNKK